MIDIATLKNMGRKQKVAFYYRLPARLQGYAPGKPAVNKELDEETQRLYDIGEVIEFVTIVRLSSDGVAARKEQLAKAYTDNREVALNLFESTLGASGLSRTDGGWSGS